MIISSRPGTESSPSPRKVFCRRVEQRSFRNGLFIIARGLSLRAVPSFAPKGDDRRMNHYPACLDFDQFNNFLVDQLHAEWQIKLSTLLTTANVGNLLMPSCLNTCLATVSRFDGLGEKCRSRILQRGKGISPLAASFSKSITASASAVNSGVCDTKYSRP